MAEQLDFEKIRPFYDSEVNAAIHRLTEVAGFIKTAKYLFPHYPIDQVIKKLRSCNSLNDLNTYFIAPFMKGLIAKSTTSFTFSGLENLDPKKTYLFISNHRDIILDSMLLNHILHVNNFLSSEIAIGSNLLILPWIADLMKLNRTFIVNRNVPVRQMLEYSSLLSNYIRKNLTERDMSVWIAQREGRTKNGDDKTQPSLLKMLNMSGKGDFAENFRQLQLVPLSVSYEYEPCDDAKVAERYNKSQDQTFKKTKVDDLMSMGSGLTSPKGRVHYGFGKVIDAELDEINKISNKNEQFAMLSTVVDKQIYANLQLNPINYAASDLLTQSDKYASYYTEDEKNKFVTYMNKQIEKLDGTKEAQQQMFLEIYANPVKNKAELL